MATRTRFSLAELLHAHPAFKQRLAEELGFGLPPPFEQVVIELSRREKFFTLCFSIPVWFSLKDRWRWKARGLLSPRLLNLMAQFQPHILMLHFGLWHVH